MKSILLITPYFAPQTHAAVFRVYKLAKYLADHNFKVHVLTVDINYLYNEDQSLLADLPDSVEIHYARYIEPTLRGIRMALGGKDRSFKAIKSDLKLESDGENASNLQVRLSLIQKIKKILNQTYSHAVSAINNPDAYWTWCNSATKKALQIMQQHDIQVFYTTSVPYTMSNIGLSLKEKGYKWVADFRDPFLIGRYITSSDHINKNRKNLIHKTLEKADVVTVLSSSYPMIYGDFLDISERDFVFIPTGLDEAYMPEQVTKKENYILFSGEFQADYGKEFFASFSHVMKLADDINIIPDIYIIGRKEINYPLVNPLVIKYGMQQKIRYIDHIPQTDLYKLIVASKACLLISGRYSHWWNNFAKMVDYIALKQPVLAIVPDPSEARKELNKAGLGLFLDGNTKKNAQLMLQFFNGELRLEPTDYCSRYLAKTQVNDFAQIFKLLHNN
ncbi:hypothetical protein [Methylobacter sp.]|uniref:hypothetical protein n=1 Tax=Methylobacter sp. TaxID=2051955 RepID=UPI003DA649D9